MRLLSHAVRTFDLEPKLKISSALVIAALVLSGCGGGSDGPTQKELFGVWKNESTGAVLDLTGATFSAPFAVVFYLQSGGSCQCSVVVLGDQVGGKFISESCRPRADTGATQDQCNVLNTSLDYTNSNAVLTVARGSETSVWR